MPIIFLLSLQFIAMTSFSQLQPVASAVYHWNELPVKKDGLREGRKLLEGTTQEFSYFEIHATTQQKGVLPRPPHAQKDLEEVIIIKEGMIKCSIGEKTALLGAGSVILVAPGDMQTFENAGDSPLTYYVLMFRSKAPMDMDRSTKAGGSLLLQRDSLSYSEKDGRGTRKYFERPTAMCQNFEMHTTTLTKKGPSHAPHQHIDTEIFLIIDGETEVTIDGIKYKGGPGDLYIVESGKMHGMSNVGEKPCSYFAFKWR